MDGGADPAAAAPAANAALSGNAPPPFLSKTYEMVEEPATDAIISWGPHGNSLVVWDHAELSRVLLPRYFKHGNFSSFVRQLNTYGFKKVGDRWEFANEGFLKGQKHLLKNISRRRSSQAQNQSQQPQPQNVSAACVEVGKFGMEGEIEMLKRDKDVLMQELVRLRQQQQTSDNQLQTMANRLEQMERRQQLMMSFLAKAMQSPGFFTQLMQQNESNRRIVSANKKRRLQMQESSNISEDASASDDGHTIKYQPIMDVLQFDSYPQLEPMNTSDSLLVDNFPSPCMNGNPGVTLEEAPQNAAIPPLIEDLSILSTIPEAIPCEFSEIQGMANDGDDIPIESFVLAESESLYLDQIVSEVGSPIPMGEIGYEHKLSDIMDSLLEEFVSSSPESSKTEGIVSSLRQDAEMQLQQSTASSRWENATNMDNLAAQMEILTSDSKA